MYVGSVRRSWAEQEGQAYEAGVEAAAQLQPPVFFGRMGYNKSVEVLLPRLIDVPIHVDNIHAARAVALAGGQDLQCLWDCWMGSDHEGSGGCAYRYM